ncbi:MAG: LEA type 2 family protein [Candidatus Thiodiazotropha sp.]
MMLRPLLLIAVLLQLLLSGCSSLGEIGQVLEGQKPTARVEGLSLTGLDMNGVDIRFDVQVDNPNPVVIALKGLDYDLKLFGSSFLQGDQPMAMNLAAKGRTRVQLPVRLGFKQLLSSYEQLRNAREVSYALDLGMGFEVPLLGRVRVPVTYRGRYPIPEMPELSLRSLDVQRITLSGARLLLQLEVDNPNDFSLLLDQLDYRLKLNGYNAGGGLTDQVIRVDKSGKGTLTLPLDLDFAQAGQGLYSALLSQRIRYDLSGSMQASGDNPVLKSFRIPLNNQGRVNLK